MSFRAVRAAVALTALLAVAMADDNDTNHTPTSAPTLPGATQTVGDTPKGATCIAVADISGMVVGDYVQVGGPTGDTLMVTGTMCDRRLAPHLQSNERRLPPASTAGSISVHPPTTQQFPPGTSVSPLPTFAPTSAPTTPGTTFLSAPVPKLAVCLPVADISGFLGGDWIRIGGHENGETQQIMSVSTSSTCARRLAPTELDARRLVPTAGSFKITGQTERDHLAGTPVAKTTAPNFGSTCFPGDATVNVYGRGATQMASLSVGDRVQVESVAGKPNFEPVLAFLHKVPSLQNEAFTVVHAQGTFRASENHIVFAVSGGVRGDMPVSTLRPGDQLLTQSGQSPILAIGHESTTAGMYAPFTSSGALVIDGVVASNYGTPSSGMSLPHGAAHAAFFALRMYHYLDLGMLPKLLGLSLVMMMFQQLRLDKQ